MSPIAFLPLILGLIVPGLSSSATPDRLAEKIILVAPTGTSATDQAVRQWQARVRRAPDNPDNYERLGWAFVAQARKTLDAGYYKLAEKTADAMEARFGITPQSDLLRGHVLHNLHRFHEAETVARRLVAERGLPYDYALLSDALMEQGKLDASVEACQHEMNLRPGLEAYSRAAQLRWLKGDLPGAIIAMEAAVKASSPLDAIDRAWTLSRLSYFYLQSGQVSRALLAAESACRGSADYPPALLARGRALLAQGQLLAALGPLQRAARLNPLPEYQWWLADALRAAGRTAEAGQVDALILDRGEISDPRTFALFLSTRREDPATAVRLAREELSNRADVFTYDALAWALAASGDLAAAEPAMRQALAEETQDARLFLHAGEIALARGRRGEAHRYFAQAQPMAATLVPAERALLNRRLDPAERTALAR